jgi:hypothetical protein
MNDLWHLARRLIGAAVLAGAIAACSSPSPKQQTDDAELQAMATLKKQYSDLVAGFDIRPQTTLIISVDLQNYIEADDTETAAMKRAALTHWRAAWLAAHPHEHAVLYVRFIDFIGRKVATETTRV